MMIIKKSDSTFIIPILHKLLTNEKPGTSLHTLEYVLAKHSHTKSYLDVHLTRPSSHFNSDSLEGEGKGVWVQRKRGKHQSSCSKSMLK